MKITDKRGKAPGRDLGLVEIEIDPGGQLVLTLHPPGQAKPAQVLMPPQQARELAAGILEGCEQIEAGHAGQS